MATSRKKAIARRLTQDWVAGYLPPSGFLHENAVEMLALDGKLIQLPATGLKWICFVRDFNSGEASNPERLLRKTFAGRPRGEGLLLHLRLADGDILEGISVNDLSLVSGQGLFLTPPDTRSNTQRLWIPPAAISELEVIAVLGVRRKPSAPPAKPTSAQESLFPGEPAV